MGEKWASGPGAEKYFQESSVHPGKKKEFDGLFVSSLGAGTYLGDPDEETDRLYEQSLLASGLSGVNFFDTAIHYRNMRSEKVLGKVVKELAARGIGRDQIVISTKGGCIPCVGPSEQFEDYVRAYYLDTGIIDRKEIAADCHCMSPSFLENQIGASLKNLGIDCIDLYSIHNPEIQLAEVGEEAFYQRLVKAFILFEKMAEEKKIRRYGIATWNGFRMKKGALQLEKILECARSAGGAQHRFKAIQLPYNLVMLEAIKVKNQVFEEEKRTIWEAAAKAKISLLVSAPLMQGKVLALRQQVFEKLPSEESPALQALQFVVSSPLCTTAFVGMRQMEHAQEDRKVLAKASWSKKIWEEARASMGVKEK